MYRLNLWQCHTSLHINEIYIYDHVMYNKTKTIKKKKKQKKPGKEICFSNYESFKCVVISQMSWLSFRLWLLLSFTKLIIIALVEPTVVVWQEFFLFSFFFFVSQCVSLPAVKSEPFQGNNSYYHTRQHLENHLKKLTNSNSNTNTNINTNNVIDFHY